LTIYRQLNLFVFSERLPQEIFDIGNDNKGRTVLIARNPLWKVQDGLTVLARW